MVAEGWNSHPDAPRPGTFLCVLDDIPDGEGHEFRFGAGPSALRVFVVRRGRSAWGYVNCCPHNFVPLNDQPDRFVTFDHEWVICSVHGAVFRYEDGVCEDGPCAGRALERVPVVVEGRVVRLAA
ncbi:MAG: Rieske 2Fe-2S domain-containing protein [Betaproteobacteria bacterium]|nr:Rieske 2Fe-2S domain-containing protein [Betaproteobacteria bacterium]